MPPVDYDLRPLTEFGAFMESHGQVAVDVGGVLVPGPDFTAPFASGKEEYRSARTRKGAQAAPSAPAHAFGVVNSLRNEWTGNDITQAELEGLEATYPDIRVVSSSSRLVYLRLSIRPFPSLPDSALLLLEVPRPQSAAATRLLLRAHLNDVVGEGEVPWRRPAAQFGQSLLLVPPIRCWARWLTGPAYGMTVLSHHAHPDLSICACMPYEWVRGVNPLADYVGMCVTWFARVLHQRDLGV